MSVSQVLQPLYSLDKSSAEFLRSLYTFTRIDEKGQYSRNLQQPELVQLVNFLDEALDVIPVTDALFRRCLRRLRLICGYHNVLPLSYNIHEGLRKSGSDPVARGGFADVWEGTHQGGPVCIKFLRIESDNANRNQKNALAPFYGEAVVWKRLMHPNVVRFLGVTTTPLQIVSEWMPNGTLLEFMRVNPSVDRMGLLLDVAEGVNYLHTCHMFHGDLKGPNILIDGSGHARVSDFGLSSIAYGKYSSGTKSDKGRTLRWCAPEVLFGTVPASRQADMFAFGMVVVEVFTGNVPFHNEISTVVSFKTMKGERPPRPNGVEALGLSDALWMMTESCWQHDPKDRLGSSDVVDLLREMYITSPSNPLVGVINGTQESVQSSSMTLETDAALSPRLLSILQYHRPTLKHVLSDTTLNDGGETADGRLLEKSGNTVGFQTSGQHSAHEVEQQFGGVDEGQRDQRFPQRPRTETLNTVESNVSPSDAWPMPKISIHPAMSITTGNSSPRVADAPGYQHFPHTDVDARKPGLQRPRLSEQRLSGLGQDLPVTSAGKPKRDLAIPGLEPIERTASRSSSVRKALRTTLGGLLGAIGLGGGSSKPSTRTASPIADRGDNSKGAGYIPPPIPPQKSAKKGSSRWGRVRGVAKVMGLQKRAQP